ncbi:DUF3710 domain-containing protein [Auritidibacter sp. NML100628]|nr:DUF3710 domain-containing protein [Auritidibacter sp. NML100628]
MKLFGRNRDVKVERVTLPEHLREAPESTDPDARPAGPRDISEIDHAKGLVDLGALKLAADPQIAVRLDVEEKTKDIIGVTLSHDKSSLQIQTFAAPRSQGLWDDIREELTESLTSANNATVTEEQGRFGTELLAKIPAKLPDGRPGWRVARFIGIDGPRWFVRAVVGGPAVLKSEHAERLLDVLGRSAIDRGQEPHPSREILRLHAPKNLRRVKPAAEQSEAGQAESTPTDAKGMPTRGPEITETR